MRLRCAKRKSPVKRRHLKADSNRMEADVIGNEAQDSCAHAQDVPAGTSGEPTRDPSPQPMRVSAPAESDGAGASDLFARLRARQAAVDALMDTPSKAEASEQKNAPSERSGGAAISKEKREKSNSEVQNTGTSQQKKGAAA
jgi:hypothetical protein